MRKEIDTFVLIIFDKIIQSLFHLFESESYKDGHKFGFIKTIVMVLSRRVP